ncbi:MAG: ORF6N domain-containing protein [Bacteroidaceae bacterium]|nr:ORF6N domain-containing protein [Bacteroidaceae bacterium]
MDSLEAIRQKIYEIRGQRVMLDFDLAEAYGVETNQLKRQVRRNLERFEGEDFMFEVTREELSRCQIGTLNVKRGQNIKYLPFAFTELGVAMLSSVLRSSAAIKVNRGIMRAFVELRRLTQTAADNYIELRKEINNVKDYIDEILADQNEINELNRAQFDAISEALAELQAGNREQSHSRKPIGFIVEKETEKNTPPTSQRTNNLTLTRNNRTQPALLRMVYSHISRVACCLLAVLLFTSCEKEITPPAYQSQLLSYHTESLALQQVTADSVHRFQQKVESLAVAYPEVTSEELYHQIRQNIYDAYLVIGIEPGAWGEDKEIEFTFGKY